MKSKLTTKPEPDEIKIKTEAHAYAQDLVTLVILLSTVSLRSYVISI